MCKAYNLQRSFIATDIDDKVKWLSFTIRSLVSLAFSRRFHTARHTSPGHGCVSASACTQKRLPIKKKTSPIVNYSKLTSPAQYRPVAVTPGKDMIDAWPARYRWFMQSQIGGQ